MFKLDGKSLEPHEKLVKMAFFVLMFPTIFMWIWGLLIIVIKFTYPPAADNDITEVVSIVCKLTGAMIFFIFLRSIANKKLILLSGLMATTTRAKNENSS